jgi:hypothetical protein
MSNPLPFAHYNPDGSLIDDPKALFDVPALTAAQVQALQAGQPPAYTGAWTSRPNADAVAVGTKIGVTDLGPNGYAEFFSDGTNWYPVGGSLVLMNLAGSPSAPIASLTSAGAAILMPAPLAGFKIPGGLLVPGRSRLRVEGYWVKSGSSTGANCVVFIGTTNSLSDGQLANPNLGAATSVWRQFSDVMFHAATEFTNSAQIAVGLSNGAITTIVRTANIDVAADMYVNWGSTNAVSGDGLAILMSTITLFQ